MDTKKILIALAASVALNCFFVGFEASRLTCPHASDSFYPQRKEAFFERGFFKHPHKGFESVFFKMSKENKKKMLDYRKKIKEAGKEIKKELLAEDFDEARFNEAISKASEVRKEVDEDMREMFLKTVKAMSAEERRELAERFEKKHRPNHKGDMKPWHKKDCPCPFAKKHFKERSYKFPKHHKEMRYFPKEGKRPCTNSDTFLPPPEKPEVFDENAHAAPSVQDPAFFHKEVIVVQEIIPEENAVSTEEQERLMKAQQDKMREIERLKQEESREARERKRAEYRKMREEKRAKRRAEREKRMKERMREEDRVKEKTMEE